MSSGHEFSVEQKSMLVCPFAVSYSLSRADCYVGNIPRASAYMFAVAVHLLLSTTDVSSVIWFTERPLDGSTPASRCAQLAKFRSASAEFPSLQIPNWTCSTTV